MTRGKLVLLRHGQTVDNLKRIDTGHNDVPLSETGEKQARAAGPLVRDIHFDKVYSSPLVRATSTAELLLEASGTQGHLRNKDGSWQIDAQRDIIEIDDGILTGRSMADDPIVIAYFKQAVYDGAPPGGESEKQLVARVSKFYEEEVLPRLARGENVLIAAHTGTIRAFDVAMGLSPVPEDGQPWKNRRPIPNAGPRVYEYRDGALESYYDIENPETVKAAALQSQVKQYKVLKP